MGRYVLLMFWRESKGVTPSPTLTESDSHRVALSAAWVCYRVQYQSIRFADFGGLETTSDLTFMAESLLPASARDRRRKK